MKDCFLFYSWSYSKSLSEAAMDIVADMFGIDKSNTKVLCKDTINNIINDWPGGSYLVLNSNYVVSWNRPQIYIGYKYNILKVLYFNDT